MKFTDRRTRNQFFRKLGAELSTRETDWAIRRAEFQYEPRPTPVNDPAVSSRFPNGPVLKTVQFPSTVYLDAERQGR